MKTKNDVRLAYKRDTGENAAKFIEDLELSCDPDFTNLEDLADDLTYLIIDAKDKRRFDKLLNEAKEVALNVTSYWEKMIVLDGLDDIKYVEWLEENVIKLSNPRICKHCTFRHLTTREGLVCFEDGISFTPTRETDTCKNFKAI